MKRKVIRAKNGRVLGEIIEQGGHYQVWKKEKPHFPPRNRNVLVGQADSLEEARRLARSLKE